MLCLLAAAGTFSVTQRRTQAVTAISGAVMDRTEASWDIHRHLALAAAAEAETFLGPPQGSAQSDSAEDTTAPGSGQGTAGDPNAGIYGKFGEALLAATAAMVRAGAGVSPASGEPDCPPAGAPAVLPPVAADPATQRAAALTTLVCLTPTYAELIGEARANNRAGNSVGQAYLRRANALMNDRLLPASATLARSHTAEAARQFERATRARDVVWLSVAAGLGLVALIGTQVLGVVWTRRWMSPALALATLLVLAGLIWPLAALGGERSALAAAGESHQLRGLLARANHLTLRAEADVLYWRIAQGGAVAFDEDYRRTSAQLACAVRGSATARGSGGGCAAATSRRLDSGIISLVDEALEAGRVAVSSAGREGVGTGPAFGSGRSDASTERRAPDDLQPVPAALRRFAALDAALTGADADTRARFVAEVARADRALWGVEIGALLLFGGAAALVTAGLEPRIREYR